MHFDAALDAVPARFVSKLRKIESRAQLAIEPGKQIEIESGRDSGGIIVSKQLNGDILHQIRAKKEGVASPQDFADIAEEILAGIAIEIADSAAEKKDEEVVAAFALVGHGPQSVEIRALVPDDADEVEIAELFFTGFQSGGRDFDGVVIGFLTTGKGFKNPARFLAASAAEFGDLDGVGQELDDFRGVLLEEPGIGARQSVFGQDADGFKERGAKLVVQIF